MSFGDDTLDPDKGKCCGARKRATTPHERHYPAPDVYQDVLTGEDAVAPLSVITYDPVNRPRHYNKGKIEVADFIADQRLNFNRGNAIKYICRAGDKEDGMARAAKEIQDLEKVIWYINHEIKVLKEKYGLSR